MGIKRYSNCIERFLSGEKGERFFNIAYSLGAAVVIWGALFEILHLSGGKTLLCIGMGTEVLMFVLTAFERPRRESERYAAERAEDGPHAPDTATPVKATVALQKTAPAELPGDDSIATLAENMRRLHDTAEALNKAGATLLKSYEAITGNSGGISDNSLAYASNMADLNRNIAGLNTIYEIQLKSVSGQLETIERVNRSMKDIRDMYEKSAGESEKYCEETEKMTRHMRQLNAVYEKMLAAMTAGMRPPVDGFPSRGDASTPPEGK